MNECVSFENSYVQNSLELGEDAEGALACVTIDGYPEDETEEGCVICEIYLTKTREFIISWHHNGYRLNEQVRELIEESKDLLLTQYPK